MAELVNLLDKSSLFGSGLHHITLDAAAEFGLGTLYIRSGDDLIDGSENTVTFIGTGVAQFESEVCLGGDGVGTDTNIKSDSVTTSCNVFNDLDSSLS